MEKIKKFNQKRKRKKTKNTQTRKGKVASKRLLPRKEGRLERARNYTAILYFVVGTLFLVLMIFGILGLI